MNKRWITLALVLLVVLTACQSGIPETSDVAAYATATSAAPTQSVSSTATIAATETPPPATQPAETPAGGLTAGCTVVSPQPTPGPTEQSMFPPVGGEDWVQGPESAYVTLIEYSDFQ